MHPWSEKADRNAIDKGRSMGWLHMEDDGIDAEDGRRRFSWA